MRYLGFLCCFHSLKTPQNLKNFAKSSQYQAVVIKALALGIILKVSLILGTLVAPTFAAIQETLGVVLFELITLLAQGILYYPSQQLLSGICARIGLVAAMVIGGLILLEKASMVASIFADLTVWDLATVGGTLYAGSRVECGFSFAKVALLALAKTIKGTSLFKATTLAYLNILNGRFAIENIDGVMKTIDYDLRQREIIENLAQHLLTQS